MHSSQVVAKESAHGQTGAGLGVQWKANAPHPICSCTSFLNSSWRQVPVRRQLAKGEESFFLGLRKGSRDNRKKKGKWVTPPVSDRSLFPEWKFTQASKWLYLGSQETEKLPHIKTKEKSKGLERRLDLEFYSFAQSVPGFLFQPRYTSRNGSVTLSPVLIRENSSTAVHILPSS